MCARLITIMSTILQTAIYDNVLSASGSLINVNYILVANPGTIPDKIPGDFGFREFRFPTGSQQDFVRESRQDSHQDFGHRESSYLSRIPPRLPPGSCRDFGRRESSYPKRIPERFPPGSCQDFGSGNPAYHQESRQDSRRDPAEILAAGNPASRQESRQDSRPDPAKDFGCRESRFLPRILARFPPGSC